MQSKMSTQKLHFSTSCLKHNFYFNTARKVALLYCTLVYYCGDFCRPDYWLGSKFLINCGLTEVLQCTVAIRCVHCTHTRTSSQWSWWFNIIQEIQIGNFWFRNFEFRWSGLLMIANIRPLNIHTILILLIIVIEKLFVLNFAKIGLKCHIWQFYLAK